MFGTVYQIFYAKIKKAVGNKELYHGNKADITKILKITT
jgi:hypothetical protein